MKLLPTLVALAATGLLAGNCLAMTRAEVQAESHRIAVEYNEAQKACEPLHGHEELVCQREAKARQKIAKAELLARRKPTAQNWLSARMAHVNADYDVAKEKCTMKTGRDKTACRKEARATYLEARAKARSAPPAAH